MKFDRLGFARLVVIALAAMAPSLTLAQQQPGDPPARVGRLARISGTVSFHTVDQEQWTRASLNYPITSGSSFWTEPKSNAAVEVGANRFYLDQSTELDLGTLNDESLIASMPQGSVYLSLTVASSNDQYEIDTPRGTVNLSEAGGYEIVAGDADNPTTVTVAKGTAEFVAGNVHLTIGPRQSAAIWGSDQIYISTGVAQDDDFVRYVRAQERPYAAAQSGPPPAPGNQQVRQPAPAAPSYNPQLEADNQPQPDEAPGYAAPTMTGYQDLDRYGRWRETPNYGRVWFPEVRSGWAPYRDGHWAYVQPWGWTWIDDAPWGFTPFHYGRWVQIDRQWAWTPGQSVQRPVYAPAIVNFIGGVATGSAAVGWVPLGPQEVYVPPYRTTPDYVRNVNVNNVRDVTRISNVTNNTTTTNVTTVNRTVVNNYVNQSAITVVPTTTMTDSRPVAPASRQIAPAQLEKVVSAGPVAPVKPTLATVGMTPTLARKIGAEVPPAAASPSIPAAPGPAVIPVIGQKPRLPGRPRIVAGDGATPQTGGGQGQPGAAGLQIPPKNGGGPTAEMDQTGKPRKPPAAVAANEAPPAGGEPPKAVAPGPQMPPKDGVPPVVTGTDQTGKPRKPAAVALNEAPPAGDATAKAVVPGPQIPPKDGAAPVVTGPDQAGKPGKPGKPGTPPAAAVLNEAPPAKAVAPGPQIPPKNTAAPVVTETDQTGKPGKPPAVVALNEAPPASGEPAKAVAPHPQIPPKDGAPPMVAGADQPGKPAKPAKPGTPPAAAVLNEAPPAKAVAPGPQIPPKNTAAPAVTETDQTGKPGKPPAVVALNEAPPAGGEAGKEAAPGPQIPPKNAAGITTNTDGGQPAATAGAGQGGCRIKGNIGQGGDRVYLMPGERHYDQTRIDTRKGERWFCTEAEAQAAGWHRAKP